MENDKRRVRKSRPGEAPAEGPTLGDYRLVDHRTDEERAGEAARRVAFGAHLHSIRTTAFDENLRDFGKRIGLSHSYLGKLENGEVGVPKRSTIYQLARNLDVPAAPLLQAAGYIPDTGTADPDDAGLGILFRALAPRDKMLVRSLITTMRSSSNPGPGEPGAS